MLTSVGRTVWSMLSMTIIMTMMMMMMRRMMVGMMMKFGVNVDDSRLVTRDM